MPMPRMRTEEDVLDPQFRKRVITEITGTENVKRKQEASKRLEVYRDKTRKWVLRHLEEEFEPSTVKEMQGRISNISVCKKVINKLAKSYSNGVVRFVPSDEQSTSQILGMAKELDADRNFIKADRWLTLFRNCLVGCVPEKMDPDENNNEFTKLKMKVLAPYAYDAIESSKDPEQALAYVLTDFQEKDQFQAVGLEQGDDGRKKGSDLHYEGDGKDQTIADSRDDKNAEYRTFIWWTNKYHFTTDSHGEVIEELSPENNENPIKKNPWLNLTDDQDGFFWADGGDDIVDSSILLNVLLTDMYAIANVQGWGQMIVSGKNVPTTIKGGPHKAIVLQQDKDDDGPLPTVTYESSNPPLEVWMKMGEQLVALLLSTNDLSISTVSIKLESSQFPSAISQMIDNAIFTGDTKPKQELYMDKEPVFWEIVRRWQSLLLSSGSLPEDFKAIGDIKSSDVQLKFEDAKPVMTEKEKLEVLEARRKLGLDTLVDTIMADNPDLERKDAEEKARKIIAEKLENRRRVMEQSQEIGGEEDGEEVQEEKEEEVTTDEG